MAEIIHVAVAVIENDKSEICISLRHSDSHQGGLWEFPGGKLEKNESVEEALQREIREELGLEINESRPLIKINHIYHDEDQKKSVCLHVCKILSYQGDAIGLEGQQVKWVKISALYEYDFPAANQAIIKAVCLPDKYLITGKFIDNDDFINKLDAALASGIKLVQLRFKEGDLNEGQQLQSLMEAASINCKVAGAEVLLNIPDKLLEIIDMSKINISGFHADSRKLNSVTQRPSGSLFSASCHNADEIARAVQLNADFIVLSPVQKTASHPDMDAMGWEKFSSLIEDIAVPVFALGGVSDDDLALSWGYGAQGVAAISAYWK